MAEGPRPSRPRVLGGQAPQTGLLMNHGRQNCVPAKAHSVSSAMMPRKITQPVPVNLLRPGTGQLFQPSRLAILGPPIASLNGHRRSPTTTTGGITRDMISSGPSFRNWNKKRKYQSGLGMVAARGSADGSS